MGCFLKRSLASTGEELQWQRGEPQSSHLVNGMNNAM